jgi:hypothetical protein
MFSKKEVKQESKAARTAATLKELYKELDALIVKFAATDASLETFIEADTPLQYELRHAVMLAVITKRLFGDLSQFLVRCTNLSVSVVAQHGGGAGSIERGEFLIIGRMRVDSAVVDATGGSVPPVVYATTTNL